MGDISKYFSKDELRCSCCGKLSIDGDLLSKLDYAREIANIPFNPTSGYRCPKHDKEIGGSGVHPKGKAVDIAVTHSLDRFRVVDGLIWAGFKRIGIAETFIHGDIDDTLPTPRIWLYPS